MGWWRADKQTGARSGEYPSKRPEGSELLNAVPARDNPGDFYNGDGPADAMDRVIKDIDAQYQRAWGRHTQPDEMRACLNFCFNGWRKRVHEPGSPPARGRPVETESGIDDPDDNAGADEAGPIEDGPRQDEATDPQA